MQYAMHGYHCKKNGPVGVNVLMAEIVPAFIRYDERMLIIFYFYNGRLIIF